MTGSEELVSGVTLHLLPWAGRRQCCARTMETLQVRGHSAPRKGKADVIERLLEDVQVGQPG
ncbi:MAG: hypothetical protein OJF50_006443 [Nitrospira sp.]|nr:hypothetical protein [Nitrospira sp.]